VKCLVNAWLLLESQWGVEDWVVLVRGGPEESLREVAAEEL